MAPPIPLAVSNRTASDSDNLSVSSVTKKLSDLLKSNTSFFSSSGETDNHLIPSDTLLAVNISEAICKGDLDGLELILKDLNTTPKEFKSPYGNLLHISTSLAKLDDFKRILKWSGLGVNEVNINDGSTPLHLATRLNRYEIAEFLLSLPEIDDSIKDIDGKTCLDYCKNKPFVNLIEYSRNVFREKTMKAMFKAIHKQKLKDLQEIIENPRCRALIDFSTPNSHGETILHVASKTENEDIVKFCLKLGVDPFVKNRRGKIAFELARKQNIRDLLKQAPMVRSKEIPVNNSFSRVEGYLYKYTNFAGGYRKRWFLLENGVLSYFNNPTEYPVSCRGSINLQYVEIIPNPSNNCKFDLIGASKNPLEVKIHLKAEAQDEAKRWMIALKQAKELYDANYENKTPELPVNLYSPAFFTRSPTLSSTGPPPSPSFSNEIDLAFMALLRQESLLSELNVSESAKFNLSDNLNNLKDLLMKIDGLLAQKNRRLEAQRKEKDLLEDAVRSLALENNKWQTWARTQLSRSTSSSKTSGDIEKQNDVLVSLENHLEETLDPPKQSDEDEEFYDVYTIDSDVEDAESVLSTAVTEETVIEEDPSNSKLTVVSTNTDATEVDEYGYPIVPRTRIPVDSSKMPAISLWNILKNAIRQQDLTRMPIPINFSEPLSMLQRMCEDLEYCELLEEAKIVTDDPARRLLYIAAFAVTSYSGTDKRISKPFNPLLGETFELKTPQFRYLSEQVSHHPPIGASHCIAEGYTYWNEVHVTSRFRGKYLELRPEGMSHLRFNGDTDAHYSWNRVNTAVNNIIVGKINLEHYGKMRIKSHGTDGLEAEIDFLPTGWRRGTLNRIEGRILNAKTGEVFYTLNGTWNQSLTATRSSDSETLNIWTRNASPSDSELFYNFSSMAMRLNELTVQLKTRICPTDSRLRPDQRAMEEGEFDLAGKLKVKLEEKQRKTRKLTESDPNFVHRPKWFKRVVEKDTAEEHWEYTGGYWETRETANWLDIPDIYTV